VVGYQALRNRKGVPFISELVTQEIDKQVDTRAWMENRSDVIGFWARNRFN
jgi:hypothetical protein